MSLRGHKPKQHDAFLSLLVLPRPSFVQVFGMLDGATHVQSEQQFERASRAESLCHRRTALVGLLHLLV